MKLSDWPIVMYGNQLCCGAGPGSPLGDCYKELMSAEDGDPDSFADLAGVIVNHARRKHGIEIERDGVWYQAFMPDGHVVIESAGVEGFLAEVQSWSEDEDREREDGPVACRRVSVYTMAFAEEWKP